MRHALDDANDRKPETASEMSRRVFTLWLAARAESLGKTKRDSHDDWRDLQEPP